MRQLALLPLAVAACTAHPRPMPPTPPAAERHADAAAVLARLWPDGCFTLAEPDGTILESDHARCAAPRRPYSTFKLANALIAVDAGVLSGPDAPMTWDKDAVPDHADWPDVWRKPHTLRSGIEVSAVPYFRTLARTLGADRMRAGLAKLAYGNQDITPAIDLFWLSGGLRISAAQQLAFVAALAHGTLGVTPHAQATVREISILERDGDRVLHGKTGSGDIEDHPGWLVWQVGYIEHGTDLLPYAAWMEAGTDVDLDAARARREHRLRATLDALHWFPVTTD